MLQSCQIAVAWNGVHTQIQVYMSLWYNSTLILTINSFWKVQRAPVSSTKHIVLTGQGNESWRNWHQVLACSLSIKWLILYFHIKIQQIPNLTSFKTIEYGMIVGDKRGTRKIKKKGSWFFWAAEFLASRPDRMGC